MTFRHLALLFVTIIATALTAGAQCAAGAVADSCITPDHQVRISLITCGPGSDIYELEGHTGLRISTPQTDFVANWGMFDFNAPNFVGRFVMGKTDYQLGLIPTDMFLRSYGRQGRSVTEQELNLTPAQAMKVYDMVMENARPENRVYRYNYIHDNCATRPLFIIEKAVSPDSLSLPSTAEMAEIPTFRMAMRRFHANYPWYQFGIDLALGSGIDYPISDREQSFAPVTLCAMIDGATVHDGYGASRQLVCERTEILPQSQSGGPLAPTPWYLTPVAVFSLLAFIAALLSYRDIRRRKLSRWFDTIFYTLLGLTGCLSAFLVFISVHAATSPNMLLLWINPLCLIIPATIWLRRGLRVAALYQYVNLAGILTFAICWIAGPQSGNVAFIPLMLADAFRAVTYIYINRHPHVS